jgi:hypothetical protein
MLSSVRYNLLHIKQGFVFTQYYLKPSKILKYKIQIMELVDGDVSLWCVLFKLYLSLGLQGLARQGLPDSVEFSAL